MHLLNPDEMLRLKRKESERVKDMALSHPALYTLPEYLGTMPPQVRPMAVSK
jgi:hypothetical protein